jgi:hypothetical protein
MYDVLCNEMVQSSELECRRDNGSFLKEREDSHDVGIWTWPGAVHAFFAPGPDILDSHPGFTDLGLDTLA